MRYLLIGILFLFTSVGYAQASLQMQVRNIRIPILMYHHIRDTHPTEDRMLRNLSVPKKLFIEHIEYFKKKGYQPITFWDLKNYLEKKEILPSRPIILTFDDGYDNNYWAAEQLFQRNQKAVFFVVNSTLDTPGHLTQSDLLSMEASGMEIGSHSYYHVDLRTITYAKAKQQILKSQKQLEILLGKPVISFCYPSGAFTPRILNFMPKTSFWFARSTEPGVSHVSGRDYNLKTHRITYKTSIKTLEKILP